MKIKSANVLITGGASGIGKIMGRMALEKGAKALIIWDVNQEALETTMAELSSHGRVYIYKVDITNSELVAQTYQQIKQEVGVIDILINCAGIVRGNKTFDQQTVQDIRLTFEVNTIAPMVIAQQILPDMIARNRGHICNIASAGGMLSNPKMSVYGASKWAMIGWSDSVRIELQQMKSNVHFTTIAPYYINTGMFNGVHSSIFPISNPSQRQRRSCVPLSATKSSVAYLSASISFVSGKPYCLSVSLTSFLAQFLVSTMQWTTSQAVNNHAKQCYTTAKQC